MGGPDDVRLAWPTVLALVRIGAAHTIFQRPLTLEEATAAVTHWLDPPNVSILDPGERIGRYSRNSCGRRRRPPASTTSAIRSASMRNPHSMAFMSFAP